jgi:hypothetical protein
MVSRNWTILQAANRDHDFPFVYLSHYQDQNGTVSINRMSHSKRFQGENPRLIPHEIGPVLDDLWRS